MQAPTFAQYNTLVIQFVTADSLYRNYLEANICLKITLETDPNMATSPGFVIVEVVLVLTSLKFCCIDLVIRWKCFPPPRANRTIRTAPRKETDWHRNKGIYRSSKNTSEFLSNVLFLFHIPPKEYEDTLT